MSSVIVPTPGSRALGTAERSAPPARSSRLALSSRVYLPACSIAVVAAVLLAIGWSQRWGGADFSGSVTSLRVIVVGPLTLAIIGVILVVERVRPAQRRSMFARGHRQDVLFTVLNATLVVPLITGLTLSFSEIARRSLPWIVLPRMGALPRWGAMGLSVIGGSPFARMARGGLRASEPQLTAGSEASGVCAIIPLLPRRLSYNPVGSV